VIHGALEGGKRGRRRAGPHLRVRVAQLVDQLPCRGAGTVALANLGKQHAQRVQVRALAGGLPGAHLGGQVALGSDHLSGARQRGSVARLGDAEVTQTGAAGAVHEHVRRLDVAVDNPGTVDASKCRE
jgi:hypothetical protein